MPHSRGGGWGSGGPQLSPCPPPPPHSPPGRESGRFHIDNMTGAITLLRAVESSRSTPAISLSVMVGGWGGWGGAGEMGYPG